MNRALRRHLAVVHNQRKYEILKSWQTLDPKWLEKRKNCAELEVGKACNCVYQKYMKQYEKHSTNKKCRQESELLQKGQVRKLFKI